MRIKEFMIQDHDRLDRVLREFARAGNLDPARRLELFHEFQAGLQRQMAWEEEVLFPLIECHTGMHMPNPSTRARLLHQQIRALLEKLSGQIRQEGKTEESEKALFDLLALHSGEEERVLCPWIATCLDGKAQEEALDKMRHPAEGKLSG
jgi:hypothetical protein